MVQLGNRVFRTKAQQEAYNKTFAGRYGKLVKQNHLLFFWLPFMLSIVAGLVFLQNFTLVRWEQHDDKYRQMNEEEMLGMVKGRRQVNAKDDYYRLQGLTEPTFDYEMVRITRKKEDEPVW